MAVAVSSGRLIKGQTFDQTCIPTMEKGLTQTELLCASQSPSQTSLFQEASVVAGNTKMFKPIFLYFSKSLLIAVATLPVSALTTGNSTIQ